MTIPLAEPGARALSPEDVKTVQNWTGSDPLPVAVLLEHVPTDLPVAERVQRAMDQLPVIGDRFAGFELVAVLGHGTFGRVYLARQGELSDRYVALKVSTDLVGESRTLARLQHTNIVPIYSVHRVQPFQAVCMPFFGATTLAHLLARYRGHSALPSTGRQLVDTLRVLHDETEVAPPLATASRDDNTGSNLNSGSGTRALPIPARPGARGFLSLLREMTYTDAVSWIGGRLADGLDHAHACGLVHNDLKPANVLLTDEGQPMLLDFGVAEDVALRAANPMGPIGGTFPYMSPEHLESTSTHTPVTDPRSDIYALGIVLFEMLTGRYPFRFPSGKLEDEVPQMLNDRKVRPPRLRSLNAAVTPGLEAIVRKCLEPDPARRYQSAADLRDDLDRHRDHQPLKHARVPSIRERLAKWSRRNPRLTSNLSLALTTMFLIGLFSVGLYARQERQARFEVEVARFGAVSAARGLDDDLKAARNLLTAQAGDPGAVGAGIRLCETALARYGLPDDDGWDRRSMFLALPESEQRRVRDRLTEVCVLLAQGCATRAGELNRASAMNLLAERIAAGEAPRALWEQRAVLRERSGDRAGAAEATERGNAVPLRTGRDFYLSGSEALTHGRYQEARKLFAQAAELTPDHYWVHMALGTAFDQLQKPADAAACFSTAIALAPDVSWGYYNRGLANAQARDYQKARDDLDRAAELHPQHGETYLNRAQAERMLRDYPAALKDLDRAVVRGASKVRAAFIRARVLELAGEKDAARRALADALRLEPTDELGWLERGLARLRTDAAGALADFETATNLNPRSFAAIQNKAVALTRLERTADAIRTFDALIELYPDYVKARAGRGVLHARQGNWKAARADAEKALELDNGPANVYQVAGIYALLTKDDPAHQAKALRLLTTALRAGFGHDLLGDDPELVPLRDTPEFQRLLEAARTLQSAP